VFNVKATIIGFLGDENKYPCHFGYKIGDEIIFDGEKCHGRVCSHVWTVLMPKVTALMSAGPRYVDPDYYVPFWYAPCSKRDPEMKMYDGVGYRSVKETVVEPPHHLASMTPPGSFLYPPPEERNVLKDTTVICPDARTSAVIQIEAFDVSALGDAVPYYRKQMLILNIAKQKPDIAIKKIRDEFSDIQKEEVYPLLAPVLVQALVEELALVGHLIVNNGKARLTPRGAGKLQEFVAGLTGKERKALNL
jgi:uncharacterized repeat protein (TIGR04076 family)